MPKLITNTALVVPKAQAIKQHDDIKNGRVRPSNLPALDARVQKLEEIIIYLMSKETPNDN